MGLSTSIREWSAVIDALGNGTQCVMVRTFVPKYQNFLLYPTYSFFQSQRRPEAFNQLFQPQHVDFARASGQETQQLAQTGHIHLKYFVTVKQCLQTPTKSDTWKILKDCFIWSPEHIQSHVKNKTGYIWLLRAYKLSEPIILERTPTGGPLTWYQHDQSWTLTGAKPVLNDNDFKCRETHITDTIKSITTKSA